ncbi:MAG: hypothetical protein IT372_15470 [Polyangiaceae bacterium]|nr:hypothetical protein [Polyangiaceae bacterium]
MTARRVKQSLLIAALAFSPAALPSAALAAPQDAPGGPAPASRESGPGRTLSDHDVIEALKDLFGFGPNRNIGLIPTVLVDFGFRPSFGVYFFYDDFGFRDNAFSTHLATGGDGWLRLIIADRFPVDRSSHVRLRTEGSSRPDALFAGIGPRSLEISSARYQATSVDLGLAFHLDFGASSSFEASTGVRAARFDDVCCEEPTVSAMVRIGRYPTPPGFDEGYTAYRQRFELRLDSRRQRPAPGTGVRLELTAEHDFDLERPQRSRWLRYGAAFGGFLDLTGRNHLIALSVATELADALADDPVPFTELAALGGDRPMRGFRAGRLLGESSIAATLEHRHPIWSFIDGSAQIAIGNVFGHHLEDFDPELLRLSFTLGVRTNGSRDQSFDVLLGSATETFEQGAALQDLRFLLGATRGF